MTLTIKDLKVKTEDKEILKGVDLTAESGKVTVLMGRNGSGKSTLANTIMGHPKYEIIEGKIIFDNTIINNLKPDERAKKGLFLSFQYPQEVSGVSFSNLLRSAYNSVKNTKVGFVEFRKLLEEKTKLLNIDMSFLNRNINEGFSGGEKKRSEILQLAVLEPKFAILDETDSGTDIDALKIIAHAINKIREDNNIGVLLITHYNRILKYIKPDKVAIMVDGKVVREDTTGKLADEIEAKGYTEYIEVSWFIFSTIYYFRIRNYGLKRL